MCYKASSVSRRFGLKTDGNVFRVGGDTESILVGLTQHQTQVSYNLSNHHLHHKCTHVLKTILN